MCVTLPPRHPRRRPVIARHPAPASGVHHPAAIMICRPAKRLVRHPRPAAVRVGPVTIRVRLPAITHHLRVGLPAVAVVVDVNPVAVGLQRIVKEIDRDIDVRLRALDWRGEDQQGRESQDKSFHHKSGVAVLDAFPASLFSRSSHHWPVRQFTVDLRASARSSQPSGCVLRSVSQPTMLRGTPHLKISTFPNLPSSLRIGASASHAIQRQLRADEQIIVTHRHGGQSLLL